MHVHYVMSFCHDHMRKLGGSWNKLIRKRYKCRPNLNPDPDRVYTPWNIWDISSHSGGSLLVDAVFPLILWEGRGSLSRWHHRVNVGHWWHGYNGEPVAEKDICLALERGFYPFTAQSPVTLWIKVSAWCGERKCLFLDSSVLCFCTSDSCQIW